MNILISACLLGIPCRYNGTGIPPDEQIHQLLASHNLIPVCPEQLGGMHTPRPPVELLADQAVTSDGENVTSCFLTGADIVLQIARTYNCTCAVLKEKSPSCGSSSIYDGTFSGRLIPGAGLTASLLRQHGIRIINESAITLLL